jgi:hypothetical protein
MYDEQDVMFPVDTVSDAAGEAVPWPSPCLFLWRRFQCGSLCSRCRSLETDLQILVERAEIGGTVPERVLAEEVVEVPVDELPVEAVVVRSSDVSTTIAPKQIIE